MGFITIIRPEFMAFCKDACKAATLNHLLFRIAGKCKDQTKEHIQSGKVLWYGSNEQITHEMSDAWGVCKVRKEINDLVKLGLFGRTTNPTWGVDRTKHFFFGEQQCEKFLSFCEENKICFVHLDLPDEVKHLIYSSNANDKSIKCICVNHQMQVIDISDAFDTSIEAITKIDYKENNKDIHKEESNAVSAETRNAHANIKHFEEEKNKRGDTDPRMKAVKKGQTDASTNHSPSSVHPREFHRDADPGQSSEARRQDVGSHSPRDAQQATNQGTLGGEQQTPISSSPPSDGVARNRTPYSDESRASGEMALTAKQIKAQNEKREKQLWDIIEAERGTKYTARQRGFYENKEGMACLIADDISDEAIRSGLQAMDAWQRKNFNVLKFYSWLPNLTAKAPIPIAAAQPQAPSNGIDHERNKQRSEALRAKFEAEGPKLKGLKLRHG